MEHIIFTGISDEYHDIFHRLMQAYAKELDMHQNRNTDPAILKRWTDKLIQKQSENTVCLKLCQIQSSVIGFLYGRIDSPDDKGFKKIGHGCIMEFYVLPEYRRKGCGRIMFHHMEEHFRKNGVTEIYLTADPVTGKPFWEALGFTPTGEISPENGQAVYKKSVDR